MIDPQTLTPNEEPAEQFAILPQSDDPYKAGSSDEPLQSEEAESSFRFASGTELAWFRLQRAICQDEFGEFWQAEDCIADRRVAVRILPAPIGQTADGLARLKASFQAVHALHHQRICPIHLLGHDESAGYFLVMHWLEGSPLADRNCRQSIHHRDVVNLLMPIAAALDHAHRQGIVHGDLRPMHINVGEDGKNVHLTGFGLAPMLGGDFTSVNRQYYIAPERELSKRIAPKSDQYSLGVIAYELLAGLPIESFGQSLRESVLTDEIPALDNIPAYVTDAIGRAMSKELLERFESCVAFMEEFSGREVRRRQALMEAADAQSRSQLSGGSAGRAQGAAGTDQGVGGGTGSSGSARGGGSLGGPGSGGAISEGQGGGGEGRGGGESGGQGGGGAGRGEGHGGGESGGQGGGGAGRGEGRGGGESGGQGGAGAGRGEGRGGGESKARGRAGAGLGEGRGRGESKSQGAKKTAKKAPQKARKRPTVTKPTRQLRAHKDGITTVAYSRDGRYVLSGGKDKELRLREAASGNELHTFKGHRYRVNCVAFSPDGQQAVSVSDDSTLRLWEVMTGKEIRCIMPGIGGSNSVTYCIDGKHVLLGSQDASVRLWNLESQREVRRFGGFFSRHKMAVWGLALSRDGKSVASASQDGTVRVWDVESGAQINRLFKQRDAVNCVAFSRDGKRLVAGSHTGTVYVLDSETGRKLYQLTAHSRAVWCVACSPCRGQLLSASWDGTVRLWDMGTGIELQCFAGHLGSGVNSVAFSPDAREAVSGAFDGTIRFWSLTD